MTRFSYGARLDTSQRRSGSFDIPAAAVGWIDRGRMCLSFHFARPCARCNVPSNLTGDLPDESGPLGEETLPPRDPSSRGPRGDLCSHNQYGFGGRSRIFFARGNYVRWPALGPTMRPAIGLAMRDIVTRRPFAYQTSASLPWAWWRLVLSLNKSREDRECCSQCELSEPTRACLTKPHGLVT